MFDTIFKSVPGILMILATAISTFATDFDGDRKADFAVFRPSSAIWLVENSAVKNDPNGLRWGNPTDVLVPGDYDGDRRTDLAVWRPQNGVWYIQQSSGGVLVLKWGMTTMHPTGGLADVPVPADYDGDSRTDIAVWRPDTGDWWILNSSNDFDHNRPTVFRWGKLGDVPVQADYDGNGRVDYAIYRSTDNQWWVRESVAGKSFVVPFGIAGLDVLVPADYNGDRKADIAVYRSGVWYVLDIATHETEIFHFGFNDDVPVPADYDGDGSVDYATYRSGTWHVYESATPRLRSFNFGQATDVPVSTGVIRQSIVAVP